VIVGYVWYTRSRDLSALEAAEQLRGELADNWWGPALFIVVYSLRPLVLFPATLLTVLGGLAFGPVWGTIWTVLASNLSTTVSYGVGRFFGSETIVSRLTSLFGGIVGRAQERPFESALLMRLLYLPFDAVGYLAGFLRLRFVPFLSGSALGTIPGTVAIVGIGASIDSLDEGRPSFDLRILLASVALAVAGSLFSRWLRSREPELSTDTDALPTSEVRP
jgi:uncharacterized membrane protein YdjX (TVP38/TMEM64 family)